MWHHYEDVILTTDTRTIHKINKVCCAVAREKIITGGVNSLKDS